MNQYNTGIFSCFLRLLPLYSSIFHQAKRKNKTIGEKIDRKKRKRRSGGESNTQHERMKMTHEMMWNVRCARQTWAWATHVRVIKCESTRKCDVWSVLFTLYASDSCSQELQRSDPINQVREYHPASILHPKKWFRILLNFAKLKFVSYTSNLSEQMYDFQKLNVPPEVDFESSRSPAKSESWNSPNLHCLAVFPT